MEQTLTRPRLHSLPRKRRREAAALLCSKNARAGGLDALADSVAIVRASMTEAERLERAERFVKAAPPQRVE